MFWSPHTRFHLKAVALSVVFAGLLITGCGGDESTGDGSTPPDYSKLTTDSPPVLASLYKQGNSLIDGGQAAFDGQLKKLKGNPVVVNAWASWCGPCRAEFPHLQDVSATLGEKVAFLGINASDDAGLAQRFLDDNPLPYPSFSDPDREISDSIGASHGFPATSFYDSDGKLTYTRSGPYTSAKELEAAVKAWAIEGGNG